jgi:hypothetical protein
MKSDYFIFRGGGTRNEKKKKKYKAFQKTKTRSQWSTMKNHSKMNHDLKTK